MGNSPSSMSSDSLCNEREICENNEGYYEYFNGNVRDYYDVDKEIDYDETLDSLERKLDDL